MGKQSNNPQLGLATPNEGTTMHHAAPLEGQLSGVPAKAVNELLPSGTAGNLSRYYWSAPLHFIASPTMSAATTMTIRSK